MARKLKRGVLPVTLLLGMSLLLVLAGLYQPHGDRAESAPPPSGPSITPLIGFAAKNPSPAAGATGVAVNADVSIGFTRAADAATIDTSSFTLKRNGVDLVTATVTYNASAVRATLNPVADLQPGTTYVATLTAAIKSGSGATLHDAPINWSFTTDTKPIITSRSPANGATNVPIDGVVTVSFSKEMDLATFTAANFFMHKSGGPAIEVERHYSSADQMAVLIPVHPLEPETVYIVELTAGVKSMAALSVNGAPLAWSFTTGKVPPHVVTKVPAGGATGVALDQIVTATFDQDMDAGTITTSSFYLKKPGGDPLAATVAYNAATRTASLDPAAALDAGTNYEVTLTDVVEAENGLALHDAPIVWSFTTVAGPPHVTVTAPTSGATGVPVNQVVSAAFDEDMDAMTITGATFYLQKSGGSPMAATVACNAATRTATLDPLVDLEQGATYQVTLSTGIEGADGQALVGTPYIWYFTTAGGTVSFSDVTPGVTPYFAAILQLANEGIILGFEDGTFRPSGLVTRQQFAKMIVLTLQLPVNGSEVCPFTDVVTQTGTDPFYPSKYVAVCAREGITQGKTATTFAPYDNITHQQLITMVARAADLPDPPEAYVPPFTATQFSLNDHYVNARKAAYAGLLDGLLGIGPAYDFLAGSTRGECAQLLYNLVVFMAE